VTVSIASGGGSLGGSNAAESDGTGQVQFSDLSIRGSPGTRTLIFAAEGFSSATSGEIVVAPGPPSPDHSSASVGNGTAGAATTISIQLKDEFGTPVVGAAGAIAISVDGANQVSSLPVSDVGDGSYSASYTPIRTGNDQITIRVNEQSISGSPLQSSVIAGPASAGTTTADVPANSSLFVSGTIIVHTRDAQSNPLGRGGESVVITFIHLDSGTRIPLNGSITDNGDGTYTAVYSQPGLGDFDVEILLNGVPIQGSPYRTSVTLF
jgi:hypothetical protein